MLGENQCINAACQFCSMLAMFHALLNCTFVKCNCRQKASHKTDTFNFLLNFAGQPVCLWLASKQMASTTVWSLALDQTALICTKEKNLRSENTTILHQRKFFKKLVF